MLLLLFWLLFCVWKLTVKAKYLLSLINSPNLNIIAKNESTTVQQNLKGVEHKENQLEERGENWRRLELKWFCWNSHLICSIIWFCFLLAKILGRALQHEGHSWISVVRLQFNGFTLRLNDWSWFSSNPCLISCDSADLCLFGVFVFLFWMRMGSQEISKYNSCPIL